VKFGNLYWQQTPDREYSIPQRLREGIDLAVLSEAHGFDSAWFAEQHFHNYGYSPNPLAMALAVAMRTSTIRVGTSVAALPLWNPVRLAEDTAFIDIMSDGRLDVGIGWGYQHLAFRGMDVPIEERKARFEECLDILLDSWTGDELKYSGNFFHLDAGVNVLPKPQQRPHPPVWFAVTSDETIRYVAKTNFRVFGSARWANNSGKSVADYELYLSERRAHGLTDDLWTYALNRQCYVIPKTADWKAEKANFEARSRYTMRMARALREDTGRYDHGHLTADPLAVEDDTDTLFERLIFGTPDQVAERILELNSIINIDLLMLQMDFGGLDKDKARLSQELFGTQVIPKIRANLPSAG
jgi:alkanesulfonate monooxygenase SsuD/methylene tetrahydromethanopterin reductase-like flavin-dependent oxidoreductase (luciferase family)